MGKTAKGQWLKDALLSHHISTFQIIFHRRQNDCVDRGGENKIDKRMLLQSISLSLTFQQEQGNLAAYQKITFLHIKTHTFIMYRKDMYLLNSWTVKKPHRKYSESINRYCIHCIIVFYRCMTKLRLLLLHYLNEQWLNVWITFALILFISKSLFTSLVSWLEAGDPGLEWTRLNSII